MIIFFNFTDFTPLQRLYPSVALFFVLVPYGLGLLILSPAVASFHTQQFN